MNAHPATDGAAECRALRVSFSNGLTAAAVMAKPRWRKSARTNCRTVWDRVMSCASSQGDPPAARCGVPAKDCGEHNQKR